MWKFERRSGRSWNDNFTELGSCVDLTSLKATSIEFLNSSKLPPNSSYMLFKNGIKPMWEDPRNVNGGRQRWALLPS